MMKTGISLFVIFCLCLSSAKSESVLLDFEGIVNETFSQAYIDQFYNGGMADPSYNGANGPDYDIVFINGVALYNITEGEPTRPSIAAFSTEDFISGPLNAEVNVERGFISWSFYYSAPQDDPDFSYPPFNVSIYSGFNSTGELLEIIILPGNTNVTDPPCDSNSGYCTYSMKISTFTGVARSINFNNTFGAVGFDDFFFRFEGDGNIEELSNATVIAIDGGYPNILYILSPTSPSFPLSSKRINGLSDGEQLLAIAQQRTTGLVWGVSNKNRLYQINPFTAVVYFQTTIKCNVIYDNPTLHASFDPQSGLLYITTLVTRTNGDLFTIDASNGQCLDTEVITYPSGSAPIYPAGAAFDVDSEKFYLVNSLPSNMLGTVDLATGEFQAIGPLGLEISGVGGFDIIPDQPDFGFAALYTLDELKSALYRIDLSTGQATLIAELNFTTNLLSFAAVESSTLSAFRIYRANVITPQVASFSSRSNPLQTGTNPPQVTNDGGNTNTNQQGSPSQTQGNGQTSENQSGKVSEDGKTDAQNTQGGDNNRKTSSAAFLRWNVGIALLLVSLLMN
eukprot:TRINITY_DN4714_c0_g1_i4.p1 TRINITY_DN4714_c0_g1~~TRINITY_DN4714_c0_g1_i4.p1  ORF type:complete len:566 (-),score=180.44 TRINITY_DN4714_c0_g1_i4:244-1941(-)